MRYLKIMSLLLAMLLTGCTAAAPETTSGQDAAPQAMDLPDPAKLLALKAGDINYESPEAARVSERMRAFAFDMAEKAKITGQNMVVSPFSLYMALSCLSLGAEGAAKDELRTVLYPKGMTDEEFKKGCNEIICALQDLGGKEGALTVKLASLFLADDSITINRKFSNEAAKYFANAAIYGDLQSMETINKLNEWAKEVTNGLIPSLFDGPLSPDAVAVLANSIYFSGQWADAFSADDTTSEKFHGLAGDTDVSMMHRDDVMPYYEDDNMQAVRLYYHGGAYMDIYLPKEGVSTEELFRAAAQQPEFDQRIGLLALPRFDTDFDIKLNDALQDMGIKAVYEGGLGGICEENDLFDIKISDVFQKAKIKLDEKGTEAAAVTVIATKVTGVYIGDADPFEMTVDRPFIYKIAAELFGQEQVLFLGCTTDIR